MSNPHDYTVGWICAIATEYVAAQAFLDEYHKPPEHIATHDNNDYTLGRIGKHNVVIAVLPHGEYGLSSAATVGRDMLHSFPNVRIGLMVGIAGGAPSLKHDIRLGDIVVGASTSGRGGVLQYDFRKSIQGKPFEPTGFLNQPPQILRAAVYGLMAQYEGNGHNITQAIEEVIRRTLRLRKKYSRPEANTDRLYLPSVLHPQNDDAVCADFCPNDLLVLQPRQTRTEDDDDPVIHYGLIASANQLIKDATIRDTLAAEQDVLCFEVESAGIIKYLPLLVIRGICDYADSHRNKEWQGYAAMTASAYAKDLLYRIPPKEIEAMMTISDYLTILELRRKVERSEYLDETARSIDGTEETTEGQPYDYPSSPAEVTVTTSSKLSRGFWTSADAQHTDASPTRTSVDEVGKGKEPDWADTESVYTSDAPEYLAYVQELATSFFDVSELPDTESLDRICAILPVLLRGFAQRIGGENQVSEHFEIMKFIHKKRRDIATCFEEYYLRDTDGTRPSQQRTPDDMSLNERLDMWRVESVMDDPNSAKPRDAPFLDDEIKIHDDDDGDEDNTDDSFPPTYHNIVMSSTAFRWLLCRVHRETILTSSEAGTMRAIATQIRQILYDHRGNCLISSKRGPPMCSMVFQSDWDPLAFVCEQEYVEEAEDAVEGAIVIVQGMNGDAEAMPCSEYLTRTWPLFGEDFMRLVKHVVRSKQGLRCSVTLFDKTKLTGWIEPSGQFLLEAAGVAETIVEVGEVYGWIIAALRSAPGDAIASVVPELEADANNYAPTFRVNFRLRFMHSPLRAAGQCWQDLFRNPVVVLGYPVRRRQPGQEPGLECSLPTLAALVGTRRIAVFCGRIFLKGFCTMLVPTKYDGDTVHWHVLFNQDGSRIPFTDSRVRDVAGDFDISEHLMLSGIETAHHVVGWCGNVRNYAGSKEANYAISTSGLGSPGFGFAFDRISISAGKIITVGSSVAVCKKEKPARAAKKSDYHKQLEWIDQRFVVLFDRKDRRAWLIDGLSALLHLVRASLAYRRRLGREILFGDNDMKESDSPYTGKAAANDVLRSKANMDLKIYEKWNRLVEETSQKGEGASETTQKTQRTWEQLPDLVGDIYATLSMIVDIQTDSRTADGFGAKVRLSPRRHLEGWDFQQVATGVDPLCPRATMLHHTGLGWVDLVRGIGAITLFGVGFGEILQPVPATRGGILYSEGDAAMMSSAGDPLAEATLCAKWARLPRGEDLLATTTPVIRDIMENVYRDTDDNEHFWNLFESIYWHNPDKIFETCACVAEKTPCDRVQVLLPTKFPKLFARGFRSPPIPLPDHGAVIFGHSIKFPLIWKLEAGSVPVEGQPPKLQLASSSSHQSDSGLGTSVTSSDQGIPSSQAPSLRQAGSGSTQGEPSSLGPSAVSADTRSGKGSRNVFGRFLRQVRSTTKSSEHSAGSAS